jgi:serine/threonine protein kinase
VLIDDDGGACLCDFGLSLVVAENVRSYFTSTIGATVRWAAPEVHCLHGSVLAITPASDIYSFGSVMLEVLLFGTHAQPQLSTAFLDAHRTTTLLQFKDRRTGRPRASCRPEASCSPGTKNSRSPLDLDHGLLGR